MEKNMEESDREVMPVSKKNHQNSALLICVLIDI
jgi:hypothetical protein